MVGLLQEVKHPHALSDVISVGWSGKLCIVCVGDHLSEVIQIFSYKSARHPVKSFIPCLFRNSPARHMCSPLNKKLHICYCAINNR